MKNMIILFLFMSLMFIFATTHDEARNVAQRDHLEKYFTEYTNHYFFGTNIETDNNITSVRGKEISKSIFKDLGLL